MSRLACDVRSPAAVRRWPPVAAAVARSAMGIMTISGTGIWSGALRHGDPGEVAERRRAGRARVLGGVDRRRRRRSVRFVRRLLGATARTIATGILNIWIRTPDETAHQHATLSAEHGHRFLLGLGVSHAPSIERVAKEPSTDVRWPDARLPRRARRRRGSRAGRRRRHRRPRPEDARPGRPTGPPGPTRTSSPRSTPPPRGSVLGDGRSSPREQGVVLETDPTTAREIARLHLASYLGLPNYANNWRRLGLHRRRHRRRRQRPPRRRPRRLGRRVDDRRTGAGAPRRRRRPRLRAGADRATRGRSRPSSGGCWPPHLV